MNEEAKILGKPRYSKILSLITTFTLVVCSLINQMLLLIVVGSVVVFITGAFGIFITNKAFSCINEISHNSNQILANKEALKSIYNKVC